MRSETARMSECLQKIIGNLKVYYHYTNANLGRFKSHTLGSSECCISFKHWWHSFGIPWIGGSSSQFADFSSSQVVAVSGRPLVSPSHLAPQGMAARPHVTLFLPGQSSSGRTGKNSNLLARGLFQPWSLFEYHTTGESLHSDLASWHYPKPSVMTTDRHPFVVHKIWCSRAVHFPCRID